MCCKQPRVNQPWPLICMLLRIRRSPTHNLLAIPLSPLLQVVPTGLDLASSLQNGSGPNGAGPKRGKLQTLFPIEVQVGRMLS